MAPTPTQEGRPLQVTSPLETDTLLLETMTMTERVSEPFELVLGLISPDAAVDPSKLLRKPMVVAVTLADASTRHVHGIVRRFIQLGRSDGFTSYQAEVVPALWFLSLANDCRIFQQKSVPDIVKTVLGDFGITDVKLSLAGSYSPREYCVQYRETHLAFISRLMEEEGIFYFFEQAEDKHTMVLADAPSAVKPGPVPKLAVSITPEGSNGEFIGDLQLEELVCTSKVTLVDYNDTVTKRLESTVAAAGAAGAAGTNLRVFDYPGKFAAVPDGDRLARIRLEEREALGRTITAVTNSRGLASGQKLDIAGHYRRDINTSYLLLSVTHSARVGDYRGNQGDTAFRYDTSFIAIPATVPYRPPSRTPKSVVHGTQTAVVVGVAGEEIYVDKYGRVKVQFFWDQLGEKNEKSSCWVRVSSSWAGKNWGAIQLPRIGQEVIVDFLEGDPDRPIITGRVYNSEQMPPYTLPDNGTQSGVLSRSSKGGTADNANEFRFEDKKGSEQVYFQAEKDLSSVVKNDELRDVQHDRTTTIKNNETKTVTEGNEATTISKGNRTFDITKGNETITLGEGDQTITISKGDQTIAISTGKQTVTIEGDRSVTIKTGNESLVVKTGNLSTEVSTGNMATAVKAGNLDTKVDLGNVSLKAGLGAISYEGMQGIELKVGQNSIKIDQSGIKIKGMMVSVEGQIQTQIKGAITQVNGDGMLQLKGGITMIN